MATVKDLARAVTPPIIWRALAKARHRPSPATRFEGPFDCWGSAAAASATWEDAEIIDRLLRAALRQRDGEVVFQRDGVELDHILYSDATLAFLTAALARVPGQLRVVDIGGSLATSYFQNRHLLPPELDCQWRVVEVPALAKVGREHFEFGPLRFLDCWRAALDAAPDGSVLFAGSLQYMPEPMAVLDELAARQVGVIGFERTLMGAQDHHEPYVQIPPAGYYAATYPAWHFSAERFVAEMTARGYRQIADLGPRGGHFDRRGMVFAL